MVFTKTEYLQRLKLVKQGMERAKIEVLIVVDPANMNYLSGYDGWSFYQHQALIILIDQEEPICVVRGIDRNGARQTCFLKNENIIAYDDSYMHSREKHPMDFIVSILEDKKKMLSSFGLEMDSFYFTAKSFQILSKKMPNAKIRNGELIVNWVRAIKSSQELEYISQAAVLVQNAMQKAIDGIIPGVRQCDVAADIHSAYYRGTSDFGGTYPSIQPIIASGEGTATAHLNWSDRTFKNNEATILELGGCRHRYHCPMARSVYLGKPPNKITNTEKVVIEAFNESLLVAKVGSLAEDVYLNFVKILKKNGLDKKSRLGYSAGLGYPPDWGEKTLSLRQGDKTVLKDNMTIHMIAGMWMDDWGFEVSEMFQVTQQGGKPFCDFPRKLFVK